MKISYKTKRRWALKRWMFASKEHWRINLEIYFDSIVLPHREPQFGDPPR